MFLLQKSYRRCFSSSSKTITNRRAQILRGEYPNSGKVQTTEMAFVDTENEKRDRFLEVDGKEERNRQLCFCMVIPRVRICGEM